MVAAMNYNTDNSSNFVAFEIPQLVELFDEDNILFRQKGFMDNK